MKAALLPLVSIIMGLSMNMTSAAEPKVTQLDWEKACGGSFINVTTLDDQLIAVEAYAEHFAEAREWICTYREETMVSALFRHYQINRKEESDEGRFTIESKPDLIVVFEVVNGSIQTPDAAMKSDIKGIIALVTASLEHIK